MNMSSKEREPDTLTIEETAKRLRIGLNSAYAGARSGEIPVIRIGRRLLVPRPALEALLAAGALIDRGNT
jgi:excisionase family DNA binding protein